MAPKTSTFFDLKTCLGKSYRHSMAYLTTRGTLTEEISEQVFSKEQRRLQAQHLWMVVKLRWGVLVDRMCVKAPTGKSKEELDALLFDRAARRNRTDPYEEKKCRGAGIKEVQAWSKKCQDWMAHFKEQRLLISLLLLGIQLWWIAGFLRIARYRAHWRSAWHLLQVFFLLAAAWVDPGRNALQSAEQRC